MIEPENIIEESRVSVYSIYLNTFAVGDSLSAEDIDILNTLAGQCFLEYGDAVYIAAAMLEIDTLVSCIEESPRYSAGSLYHAAAQFVKIWPNPTTEYALLTFSGYEKLRFQIIDITGRIIFSEEQLNNTGSCHLDLKYFQSGLYFINAYDGPNLIKSLKLIKN